VIYSKGTPTSHLKIPVSDLEVILREGKKIVDLLYQGRPEKVLISDVQYDHLGEKILHVDLKRISPDQEVIVEVPLILKGIPKGITEEGGKLDQYVKLLKISCLATNVPDKVEMDITDMKLDQTLYIKDIPVSGIKILQDLELGVAKVVAPKVAEVAPPGEVGLTPAEPELIRKEPKKEEEPDSSKE
jgi:large subunit ribosomal protein L25